MVFGQSRRRDPADVDGGRFNAILDDWARGEGLSDVEGRSEAAMRIRDWVSAGDVDHELDLSGLGLSSLSNVLPSTLRRLDVSGNRLETLEDLPSSLVLLRAYNNSITKLSGRPPACLT